MLKKKGILFLILMFSFGVVLAACGGAENVSEGAEDTIKLHVIATNWDLETNVTEIPLGSTVEVTMENAMGRHNILIEGYEIEVEEGETITFTADKEGEFIIRCNIICGALEDHENQLITFQVK